MKRQAAVIVLAVLLVAGGVFAGIKITDLTEELNELESRHAVLQYHYDELEVGFNSLMSKYDSLESEYSWLQSSYSSLESDYWSLESNYESISSEFTLLQGSMSQLESIYRELQAENEGLEALLREYERVPHGYYSIDAFSHHSNTYEELCNFLTWEFALPRGYKVGVFDCSESAAYLEWALETAGFDADIIVGDTPWDTSSRHAWVIAHPKGYRVAIEATALTGEYKFLQLFLFQVPGVVYKNDPLVPGWENYYEGYDGVYGNIYQAIHSWRSTDEWNWWEGYWGFV